MLTYGGMYGSIGYDTFRTSAIERIGLDDIQEVLKAEVINFWSFGVGNQRWSMRLTKT